MSAFDDTTLFRLMFLINSLTVTCDVGPLFNPTLLILLRRGEELSNRVRV